MIIQFPSQQSMEKYSSHPSSHEIRPMIWSVKPLDSTLMMKFMNSKKSSQNFPNFLKSWKKLMMPKKNNLKTGFKKLTNWLPIIPLLRPLNYSFQKKDSLLSNSSNYSIVILKFWLTKELTQTSSSTWRDSSTTKI